ncbi:MAG: exodeoxyribonuclease VII large subunit [Candidatus Pacebacteria bacterium]|jgi:exodeoxyribonuclease VII large subunit|nr:exodeoxyribonuclease VII large subunit [Candidatus Paceibacterota bacterium]
MEFEDIKQKNLFDATVMTVEEFVKQLNSRLKPFAVKIIGEVSELKPGPTGHMYFSLKDEKTGAVMPCALWKSRYDLFGVQMKMGMKLIAGGHAEVYAPSGRLSFICDSIELAGEGALKAAYDALLKKLESEGVFAPEKKRPIPKFSRRIGIVTAKQGAVIHDFLNNIGKFGFQIEFIDSRVEGQLAVPDLMAAIKTFARREIDVLVVMRGGGSLEAMLAFNNETVVRAIAGFPKPVIAAIGHDKDVPLAAMAADAMVSTPTAAANLLTQSWQEIPLAIRRYEMGILGGYRNALEQHYFRLRQAASILPEFRHLLENISRAATEQVGAMFVALENSLGDTAKQLDFLQKIIESHNPERQLKLGYSISRVNGKILKSICQAKSGDLMDVLLADGIINSQITNTHGKNNKGKQP